MKEIKVNNKLAKFILTCTVIVAIGISIMSTGIFNTRADVSDRPNLSVSIDATPNPAHTGEDITVKTTITPEPFTRDTQKQQIVMVLDVSGSMDWAVGNSSRKRIDDLKVAAKNFIETVSNDENLEICIIEYSTSAVINPVRISGDLTITPVIGGNPSYPVYNYISGGEVFYNAKDKKKDLLSMIDCLQAKGGTNMGEGLRKAEYMLSQKGNANAKKSVVFMTDGIPQHYSLKKVTTGYWPFQQTRYENYTDIDNKTPYFSSTDENGGFAYAKTMANNIKIGNYTAYSVGFAVDTNHLAEIHKSMGGKDANYLITEDNINEAFGKIADSISSNVVIDDVEVTLKLQDFALSSFDSNILDLITKDDNNILKLNNIVYTYNSKKKMYEAEPIVFEFILRGSKPGIHDPLKDSYLSFTVEGKQEKIPLAGMLKVMINERNTPDINVSLVSMSPSTVQPGQEVTVTYKITTEDFGYYLEEGSNMSKLSINDAKFNLDLGTDFEAVENGGLTNENGMYVYKIPSLEYYKVGTTNAEGQELWRQTNPEGIEVSFKVKVASGKYGNLNFNSEQKSTMTYTNFAEDLITKNLATSEILSNSVSIIHGISSSTDDGEFIIEENTGSLGFAENSFVTIAASVKNCINNATFKLNLAEGVTLNGDIKVYSVGADGNLIQEGIMTKVVGEENTYTYILILGENASTATKDIVLMYTEKLPSKEGETGKVYSNNLTVDGTEKEIRIQCSEKLPDLY